MCHNLSGFEAVQYRPIFHLIRYVECIVYNLFGEFIIENSYCIIIDQSKR